MRDPSEPDSSYTTHWDSTDSDRTGGRRAVRGARPGARTADLDDLERSPSKRWPARVSRGQRGAASGQKAPSPEVDALRGKSRPRPPCRDSSPRARLTDDDRDRARTSRWDRRAHGVTRDDLPGDLRTRGERARSGARRVPAPQASPASAARASRWVAQGRPSRAVQLDRPAR